MGRWREKSDTTWRMYHVKLTLTSPVSNSKMFTCQVCGKPCCATFPCTACHALFYCCKKHRSAHQQCGHDQKECSRMAQQLDAVQLLELSWFPWWASLHSSSITSTASLFPHQPTQPTHEQEQEQAGCRTEPWPTCLPTTMISHSSHSSVTSEMLQACWHAHHHHLPASSPTHSITTSSSHSWPPRCLDPHPQMDNADTNTGESNTKRVKHEHATVLPPLTPPDHQPHKQNLRQATTTPEQMASGHVHPLPCPGNAIQSSPQQQDRGPLTSISPVLDWPSAYSALGLPSHDPAALVLHFAASLAYSLTMQLPVLGMPDRLEGTPVRAGITDHPHHKQPPTVGQAQTIERKPVYAMSATGPTSQPGLALPARDIASPSSLSDGGNPHKLHILYLGPELEMSLLDTFTSLLAFLGPDCPWHQIWIHWVGPCVPTAWHGQAATFKHTTTALNPSVPVHGLHATFWHGCLHEVAGQLSVWFQEQQSHAQSDATCKTSCTCAMGTSCLWHVMAGGGAQAVIWAPNAGLVAYPTWIPTLDKMCSCPISPPLLSTDYCEEALVKAKEMMVTLYPRLHCMLQPQPNPFRQPWKQQVHGNALPAYSNGFIAGWCHVTS